MTTQEQPQNNPSALPTGKIESDIVAFLQNNAHSKFEFPPGTDTFSPVPQLLWELSSEIIQILQQEIDGKSPLVLPNWETRCTDPLFWQKVAAIFKQAVEISSTSTKLIDHRPLAFFYLEKMFQALYHGSRSWVLSSNFRELFPEEKECDWHDLRVNELARWQQCKKRGGGVDCLELAQLAFSNLTFFFPTNPKSWALNELAQLTLANYSSESEIFQKAMSIARRMVDEAIKDPQKESMLKEVLDFVSSNINRDLPIAIKKLWDQKKNPNPPILDEIDIAHRCVLNELNQTIGSQWCPKEIKSDKEIIRQRMVSCILSGVRFDYVTLNKDYALKFDYDFIAAKKNYILAARLYNKLKDNDLISQVTSNDCDITKIAQEVISRAQLSYSVQASDPGMLIKTLIEKAKAMYCDEVYTDVIAQEIFNQVKLDHQKQWMIEILKELHCDSLKQVKEVEPVKEDVGDLESVVSIPVITSPELDVPKDHSVAELSPTSVGSNEPLVEDNSSKLSDQFDKGKKIIQTQFIAHLDALRFKALFSDDPKLNATGKTLYKALHDAQKEFFNDLSSENVEIKIEDFRKTCQRYVKDADALMQPGWVDRISEVLIKAVGALVVGLGMIAAGTVGQGIYKPEHRQAYRNRFFTFNQSEESKALQAFNKTVVDEDENSLLSELVRTPKNNT